MKALEFKAREFASVNMDAYPALFEGYKAGFREAIELASGFAAELNNPGMAILIGAICTTDVNPETGVPLHFEEDEREKKSKI